MTEPETGIRKAGSQIRIATCFDDFPVLNNLKIFLPFTTVTITDLKTNVEEVSFYFTLRLVGAQVAIR